MEELKNSKIPKPFDPESLKDIFGEDSTIQTLLSGFRDKLQMGVVLYVTPDINGRIDLIEARDRYWAAPCRFFRSQKTSESKCEEADLKKVKEIFNLNKIEIERIQKDGINAKDKKFLYDCCPLGMKDMAYPIVVQERILGVILSGQRLLKENLDINLNLDKATKSDPMRFSSTKESEDLRMKFQDEIDNIENKYYETEQTDKKSFICTKTQLNEYFDDFKKFGELVTDIACNIAEKNKQLEDKNFINWVEEKLGDVPPDSYTLWQPMIKEVLDGIISFKNKEIEAIAFFKGEHPDGIVNYSLIAMNDNCWIEPNKFDLPADFKTKNKYTSKELEKLVPSLFNILPESSKKDKFYYLQTFQRKPNAIFGEIYSLILIQTQRKCDKITQEFYKDYCESLFRADSFVRLFIRQMGTHDLFEQRVTDIKHDLKTAMQYLQSNNNFLIAYTGKDLAITSKYELSKTIIDTQNSLNNLNEIVEKLVPSLEFITLRFEKVDLFKAVDDQVVLFNRFAESKGIRFIYPENKFPNLKTKIYIFSDPYEIKRAIDSLIDNAIKYSFFNKKIIITGEFCDSLATFSIKNYGVGIPPDKLEEVKRKYIRANVKDEKYLRKGTGLGLSIANNVFCTLLKGEMDISSDSRHTSEVTKDYLEYTTIVTVKLPIK